MISTLLWYVLAGAVVGIVARLLVPGRNPIGIILTILVGAAGAIVGGVVAGALGAGDAIAVVIAVLIAVLGVVALTTAQGGGWRGPGGRGWGYRRHSTR
ncbi:MAG: hypothetical protein GEV11_30010 [Streptosporangiales bacterium]|nr:hypothetical protein [Streptosporangiales bacterium]